MSHLNGKKRYRSTDAWVIRKTEAYLGKGSLKKFFKIKSLAKVLAQVEIFDENRKKNLGSIYAF